MDKQRDTVLWVCGDIYQMLTREPHPFCRRTLFFFPKTSRINSPYLVLNNEGTGKRLFASAEIQYRYETIKKMLCYSISKKSKTKTGNQVQQEQREPMSWKTKQMTEWEDKLVKLTGRWMMEQQWGDGQIERRWGAEWLGKQTETEAQVILRRRTIRRQMKQIRTAKEVKINTKSDLQKQKMTKKKVQFTTHL